jgi:hypothetical protein
MPVSFSFPSVFFCFYSHALFTNLVHYFTSAYNN